MMAADASSLSMDSFKIGMLALGVVCTFAAMIYLMHMAEEVLKHIDEGAADRLLPSPSGQCGVGITFEEGDDEALVVARILPGTPAALSGKVAALAETRILLDPYISASSLFPEHQLCTGIFRCGRGGGSAYTANGPHETAFDVERDRSTKRETSARLRMHSCRLR
jgi:hypothetical protein